MEKLDNKSFSLIESIFAITILVVIIISFFSTLTMSVNYVRRSQELRLATLVLQEQISLVRDLKYSDIQALGNTFNSDGMATLKNASGTIKKSNYGGSDKILKITYQLDWIGFDGRPENRGLTTLITSEGIDKK